MACGLGAAFAFAISACDEPPDPRLTNFKVEKPGVTIHYDEKTGRLKKIESDLNKDGKFETWSYWDGTKLGRIEIDQDEDGKIDRWEHYNGIDAKHVVRVGSSSRDDGVEDTWTYPDGAGELAKVETDADGDGHLDKRRRLGRVRRANALSPWSSLILMLQESPNGVSTTSPTAVLTAPRP